MRSTRRSLPVISNVVLGMDLDFDVDSSYVRSKKWRFEQDVWEAQNPEDRLSNLPANVRQIMQRHYILKRPLDVLWAFLRMTIGLPIEVVIKILIQTGKVWKIWVPRPPPIRPMRVNYGILDRMPAYRYERSGSRRNIN